MVSAFAAYALFFKTGQYPEAKSGQLITPVNSTNALAPTTAFVEDGERGG
jgi:hypothetical protein